MYALTAGTFIALTLTAVIALDDLGGDAAAFLHDIVDQRIAGLSICKRVRTRRWSARIDRLAHRI